MTHAMTQESTGKVMSLLGAALLSLAFLFGAAYTDASFERTEVAMPSPFDPQNVVGFIDHAANSYSNFLYAYVIDSVSYDYALAGENLAWIGSNAKSGLYAMAGIEELPQISSEQLAFMNNQPVVAGAYDYVGMVQKSALETQGVLQALYSILVQ